MKGTKEEPKCKYSRAAINKLNEIGLTYNTYNILNNIDLRNRLKKHCPTYPQLWYKYKFVCNGDKLKEDNDLLIKFLDEFKNNHELNIKK